MNDGLGAVETARTARDRLDAAVADRVGPRAAEAAFAALTALLAELGLADRLARREVPDPDHGGRT